MSCYDLGRQPVVLASIGSFLEQAGFDVDYLDLAVEELPGAGSWNLIAVSVPMHTALRVAMEALPDLREVSPGAHVTFFGYYGWLNADSLLENGLADSVVGGEPEQPILDLVQWLESKKGRSWPDGIRSASAAGKPRLSRPAYPVPERSRLPALKKYAKFVDGDQTCLAAAVEASRGCKVLCTHCPIPPVYGGRFLAVPGDVVLRDITNLAEAGVGHITFADPDFLNGPTHAARLVEAMHHRFPDLTFDFTARVRHILDNRDLLPLFAACGARFAVSAVESLNSHVLQILEKGHTPDEAREVVRLTAAHDIALRPSLLPFNPWSSLADYEELLNWVEEEDLVLNIDPVHFSIRLLVPPGSLLVDHPEMKPFLKELDQERLCHTWVHPDPQMDRLHREVTAVVEAAARSDEDPYKTYTRIRSAFETVAGRPPSPTRALPARTVNGPPRLTENWFC